uniref:CASP-like protein n=1 Tax=Taenia asiatica TaxID=60517 RepID=A0A0R3W841_TAEAS
LKRRRILSGLHSFVQRDGGMRYFVTLTCLFSAAYFAVVDMMRKDLQFRTYSRTHVCTSIQSCGIQKYVHVQVQSRVESPL